MATESCVISKSCDIVDSIFTIVKKSFDQPYVLPLNNVVDFSESSDAYYIELYDNTLMTYYKTSWNVSKINEKQFMIYEINYIMDNKVIERKNLVKVSYMYALNVHYTMRHQHNKYNLNTVACVDINKRSVKCIDGSIFTGYYCLKFNIIDLRKVKAQEANEKLMLLCEYVPAEIALHIMSFVMPPPKNGKMFTCSDFDFNFAQEYTNEIPEILTKYQLKKLYMISAIKLAISRGRNTWAKKNEVYESYIDMTDDSFNYIYPNGINDLQNIFNKKIETMKNIRDMVLEKYFKDI